MPVIAAKDFNLDATLLSGQVFRWERFGEYFYGVVGQRVFKCRQLGDSLGYSVFPEEGDLGVEEYFRLGDVNYPELIDSINRDEYIGEAIQANYGMRILRQELWETLISYIISANKNIPGIKSCINNMCRRLGRKIVVDGLDFYTFPTPQIITKAGVGVLRECKLGFRADYVWMTAKLFAERRVSVESLSKGRSSRIRTKLLGLKGVGEKIADCVLLFALGFDDVVPFDVWMKRTFVQLYELPESTKNGDFRKFARKYFGKYAGWAHGFLYYYCRERVGRDKDIRAVFS